jgi:hypothetical protein
LDRLNVRTAGGRQLQYRVGQQRLFERLLHGKPTRGCTGKQETVGAWNSPTAKSRGRASGFDRPSLFVASQQRTGTCA